MSKITVKRIVPMFTVVTDKFKKELQDNSNIELKIVDDQINAIHMQIKQLQSRFGLLKSQSTKTAQDQINRSIMELTERAEQLNALKQGMLASIEETQKKPNGSEIQTGFIENYVELNKGDNIRNIFERAKIVIKDDVIQEIVD